MELVKIAFSRASEIFTRPLITFLPLFGFAADEKQAAKRIEAGEIRVNVKQIDRNFVCQPGDLVMWNGNGIIIEEGN